ncbi:MAG: hypothetical protein ABI779_27420 [Acidobacteriota bacterium]
MRITPSTAPAGCRTLNNPACGYASVEDPAKLIVNLLHDEVRCLTFADPTPPLSSVTSVDLRFPFEPRFTDPASMTVHLYGGPTWFASNDSLIGTFLRTGVALFSCTPPYYPLPEERLIGADHPDGIAGYVYGGNNALVFENTLDLEFLDITVHYRPPPSIDFDLTATTDEKQKRVLIKRWRDENPYFSDAQESLPLSGPGRDGRIRIAGRVTDQNGPMAQQTVYLRLVDPPDVALYVPAASRLRGDNDDGPGALDQTTVTTDGSGRFATVLNVTGRAAGDNYQIEATTLPGFAFRQQCDATNNCYKSGVLTAWKRMYVEKRRMLRNGMFIAQGANAGATSIVVRGNRYGGNRPHDRLSRGDQIVLVHAPDLDRSNLAAGWYMESHTILDVTQGRGSNEYIVELGTRLKGGNVSREALLHDYGPDRGRPDDLGDAITGLSGNQITASDTFDASNDLVAGDVFADAFTEYIYLSDGTTPGAKVPVPFIQSFDQPLLQDLADKWSSVVTQNGLNRVTAPNHQLLVIGASNNSQGPGTVAGVTISDVLGETSSYVFRGTIEEEVRRRGGAANAELWAMKTAAHELAHQWKTNGVWGRRDHCPPTTTAFDNPAVYCLLSDADPARSEAQRSNGIARFHGMLTPTGVFHSEYLEIRRHSDPFTP